MLNRIRLDVLWSVAGQVLQAAVAWGIVVFLARRDPSGALIGKYALAAALSAPLFMLASLQLRPVVASDAKGEFAFSDYFGLRIGCLLLACALAAALVATGLVGGTVPTLVMGLSLLRCVDLTSDLFQAFLQRMGAISTMAKLGLLRTVLSTAAFLCVFQLSSSLFLAVMASAITAALVVVAVEVPVVRHWSQGIASAYPLLQHWIRLKPRFDAATLQRLFKRVIPLGGTALLGSLFVQLPLYIIGHKMGKGDVGYFAVVYNPSIVIQVFMVGVLEGLLSRLSNAAATGDAPLLRHLMGRAIFAALAMGTVLTVGSVFLGRYALSLVYGATYAEQAKILVILTLAASIGFVAMVLGYGLMSLRMFRVLLGLSLLGFPLAVAAVFFMTQNWGVEGTAWAVVTTNVLSLLLHLAALVIALKSRNLLPPPTAVSPL